MATQKPISTISYNTESFLSEKLNEWVNAHIIQAYQYIFHKGEDGDKDHIHVRIEPNKKLDPMQLSVELREYDTKNPTKPLGCRPWRPSKEEDWYLYAVHDEEYLKLKYGGGEKGEKLPYHYTDIKVSEFYDLEVAFVRAKSHLKHSVTSIAQRLRSGEDPMSLLLTGENVFTINAVTRVLSDNDYQRQAQELADVRAKLDKLLDALELANISVSSDDDGNIVLELPSSEPSFYKAPQSHFVKSDDALRIEVVKEASEGIEIPRPSFYEVHPQAEFEQLDIETELPF